MNSKYLKSAIVLSLLSWMSRKKYHQKSRVWRKGLQKCFAGVAIEVYGKGLKKFQKRESLTRKVWGKKSGGGGGGDPQRNYVQLFQMNLVVI